MAQQPALAETIGDVERWHGIAYVTTPDGTNVTNVWFMVDLATGNATWQMQDTLENDKNTYEVKRNLLNAYLKANFAGFFLLRVDLDNNWAEADVYTVSGSDLAKSTVLVYKQGTNPITHRKVV